MPQRCLGVQTFASFTANAPSCIYQIQLLVDGSAITNQVAVNSGMTTTQIATLLNANRIGNTTGTFTASISGTDLLITITNITLPSTGAGAYNLTVSGTGFPCGNPLLLSATLTCTVVSNTGGGIGGYGKGFPLLKQEICFRRQRDVKGNLIPCPDRVNYLGRQIYVKISEDNVKCCYRKANSNDRGSQTMIPPKQ